MRDDSLGTLGYDGSMDEKRAKILEMIAKIGPCTKLAVKEACGYSMTTVLGAVQALAAEGWIVQEETPSAYGGRPHAALYPTDKLPVGSIWERGIERRIAMDRKGRLQEGKDSPILSVGKMGDPLGISPERAQAMAWARRLGNRTAVLDGATLRWVADGKILERDLGGLPSPMLGKGGRLCVRDAIEKTSAESARRVLVELREWIGALLAPDHLVVLGLSHVPLSLEVAVAEAAWWVLLWSRADGPIYDRARCC